MLTILTNDQIREYIILYSLVWVVIFILLFRKNLSKQNTSASFSVIYLANLALIHFISAIVWMFPWHVYISGQWMLDGFRITTIAVVCFYIGYQFTGPFVLRIIDPRIILVPASGQKAFDDRSSRLMAKVPRRYFFIGLFAYLVLPIFTLHMPTVNALVNGFQQLMLAGLCLICWQAARENNRRKFNRWLAISFLLPIMTVVSQGFLGFGVSMLMVVFLFSARYFRAKLVLVILGLVITYFGMTFYQTYFRERAHLREVIWNSKSSMNERFTTMFEVFSNPVWFNPLDLSQLERVDERMNQNFLVGASYDYLVNQNKPFASGATLYDSVLAMVPRALWRGKTIVAGSSDIVSRYTGLEFMAGTSVGVGQVMELFINFGIPGVIVGFIIIGVIISCIDIKINQALLNANVRSFVMWFLPGMSIFNVGGSFIEVTSSAGASLIVAYLIFLQTK